MKFMITFAHVDGEWDKLTPSQREELGSFHKEFQSALEAHGSEMIFLDPKAKTVRRYADGRFEVADEPYRPASTTGPQGPESAGGYFIIEADSMEEAVEWAKRGRWMVGANEVRQIHENVRF